MGKTTGKPTKHGFYWYHYTSANTVIWEPVQYDEDGDVWVLASASPMTVDQTDAADWGPEIPMPLLDGVPHQEVPR